MPGPLPAVRVSGGARVAELTARGDLHGQRVSITGKLQLPDKGSLPVLSVEEWKPSSAARE